MHNIQNTLGRALVSRSISAFKDTGAGRAAGAGARVETVVIL